MELYKSERFQSSAEGMYYNDPAFKAGFWNNEDNSGAGLGSCIGKVGASARKRKVWRLGSWEVWEFGRKSRTAGWSVRHRPRQAEDYHPSVLGFISSSISLGSLQSPEVIVHDNPSDLTYVIYFI